MIWLVIVWWAYDAGHRRGRLVGRLEGIRDVARGWCEANKAIHG